MSIPPAFDLNEWDLRHYIVASSQSGQNSPEKITEDPQFIESLLATIENADAAAVDGWQLARVKVESDVEGRRMLDVWLKRQKTSASEQPQDVPPSNRAA
jgi:hypothetical protein